VRVNLNAPTEAFSPGRPSKIRKYRAYDKLMIKDHCGRELLAYDTIKVLIAWRRTRSTRPFTRADVLRDLQALLEGLLTIDEKGNVAVPQPLPSPRTPQAIAGLRRQITKAAPVVARVLKGL